MVDRLKLAKKDPDSFLIISYSPLLYGSPANYHNLTEENLKEMVNKMEEYNCQARACLWAMRDDKTKMPVFMISKMKEVLEHLKWYTTEEVEKWFSIAISDDGKRYSIVLMPNLELAIERYKVNYGIITGNKLPDNPKYTFLFNPLRFLSENIGSYNSVKGDIGSEIYIGFIDSDDVDTTKPDFIKDIPEPVEFGPFKVIWNTPYGLSVLKEE
jgi:hypothetical protein